jgi:cytoskeleton protein RodZ
VNAKEPIDVGDQLRQARERQGLTLSELARRTKISVIALRAIERNDFDELPGGIFTRGFLRAYAREVGCDAEEIVCRYRETFEQPKLNVGAQVGPATETISTTCEAGQLHVADIDAVERKRSHAAFAGATAALIIGLGFYLMFRNVHPEPAVVSAAIDTAPLLGPTRAASALNPAGGVASTTSEQNKSVGQDVGEAPRELRVDIQLQGTCWVSATADKERVVYRQMNLGEHARINAREDLVLRIGDPASVRFSINGRAARQLGAAGQPMTAHITRQNYQEFLTR